MDESSWKDPFFAAAGAASGSAGSPGSGPVRLVAVDLDGVVWLGGSVLPDAPAALSDILRRGLDLRYVTNNSTAHRETVSARLAAAGLPAGADRVLTSGYVTARWLRQRLPEGAPVLVVGEPGLMRELSEAGLAPVHAGEEAAEKAGQGRSDPGSGGAAQAEASPAAVPQSSASGGAAARTIGAALSVSPSGAPYRAVVVGMDRGFHFKMLAQAQAAVLAGALFVGTNPDRTFPTPAGLLPGTGSVVAAVATAAQKEPTYMGKPGLGLAEILASVTGVPAAQTLFLGDRMSTDIGMGIRAGMVTALVLTGVTTPAEFERIHSIGGPDMPDHVLRTLADLPALLDSLER